MDKTTTPTWRTWLALAAGVLLLPACSLFGGKEPLLEPAELNDINRVVALEELWSTRVGSGNGKKYTQLVPVVSDDNLYAADVKGRVIAVNRHNGDYLWEVDVEASLSGGVGAGYGLVLVGTEEGEVIALGAGDGSQRWRATVSSEVLVAPQTNGRVVLVQSTDDNLHALDPETGERRWTYDSTVPVLTLRGTSRPLVGESLVVAGFANGKLVGLNADTGQPVWEYRVGIPTGDSELERIVDIDGELAASGDTVYAASYQGRVSAVDAETGVSRWDRDTSSYRGVGVDDEQVYLVDADGHLQALNRYSSQPVWQQEGLKHRGPTTPVVIGSSVVVGDFEGYLHLLAVSSGDFVGRVQLDASGIRSRPLVMGDTLYVMSNGGRLAALRVN